MKWLRHLRRGWWLPLLLTVVLWLALLVWPVLQLAALLWPAWQPGTAVLLLVMVLPLTGRMAWQWRPGRASRVASALALTWMGLCFVLFCLLLPALLLRMALAMVGVTIADPLLGMLVAGSWLTLGLAGVVNAQLFQVRRITVPVPAAAGSTLVQVSDVHIGSRMGGLLQRLVPRINALAPDRVVITGDLVDFRDVSAAELAPLAQLQAPTWYCIGNHERYVDLDAICARLRDLGIRVLRNQSERHGAVQLIGIDDAESRDTVAKNLPGLPTDPTCLNLLLYHRPDGFEAAAQAGIDLMLTGHTHNGQIVPFHLLVRRVFPRICGLYQLPGRAADGSHRISHLYVSPGTGTWGPVLRLGSRNEITLFTLAGEPAADAAPG